MNGKVASLRGTSACLAGVAVVRDGRAEAFRTLNPTPRLRPDCGAGQ